MQIKSYPNGIYGATTYLVYDELSKEAFLVDCTSSIDEIYNEILINKLNLKYILITHGHFDHVYCLEKMKKYFPTVPVFIHKEDMDIINKIDVQCEMSGVEEIKVPCVDALLDEDSKNLEIGNKKIEIIHTPGHSRGGVCYLTSDNILFSGDTLFRESVGRCDLFGGDFNTIQRSIKEKLFVLPDEVEVYPGHGNKTTIGHEKRHNPYLI